MIRSLKSRISPIFFPICRVALTAIALLFFWCSLANAAVQLTIEVNPPTGTVTDTFTVSVTVLGEDANRFGAPEFENSDQFRIQSVGQSREIQIVNGSQSSSITYNFNLYPTSDLAPGTYEIPQGYFVVELKKILFKRPTIKIEKSSTPTAQSHRDGVAVVQVVDNLKPYIGQQVLYTAEIAATAQFAGPASWSNMTFEGFKSEELGAPRDTYRIVGGERTLVSTMYLALFPIQSGKITLQKRELNTQLRVARARGGRRSPMDDFDQLFPDVFSVRAFDTVSRRFLTEPIEMDVRPLPPAPATDQKYIPVGSISVKSHVDKKALKQGDSVTLTIEVEGDGNLDPLEIPDPPNIADKFRVYRDKPIIAKEIKSGKIIYTKKYSMALIPLAPGKLELPIFKVLTFNPEQESYKTFSTEGVEIEVAPDPNAGKLVVAGTDNPAQSSLPDKKQEIKVLGTDLLPQHIGPQTLVPRQKPISRLPWWIGLSVIASLLLRTIAVNQRALRSDPRLALQLGAYKRALDALAQLEQRAVTSGTTSEGAAGDTERFERSFSILRTFLGERFRVQGESLTPEEAKNLVLSKTKNNELGIRVRDFLSSIEKLRFSGGRMSASSQSDSQKEARALVDEIEKSVSTKRGRI